MKKKCIACAAMIVTNYPAKTAALLLTAALAGCATPISFGHPNSNQEQYTRDVNQCIYEVTTATAGYGTSNTVRSVGGAMGQGFGEGIAVALKQRELAILCMQAKGYYRK